MMYSIDPSLAGRMTTIYHRKHTLLSEIPSPTICNDHFIDTEYTILVNISILSPQTLNARLGMHRTFMNILL